MRKITEIQPKWQPDITNQIRCFSVLSLGGFEGAQIWGTQVDLIHSFLWEIILLYDTQWIGTWLHRCLSIFPKRVVFAQLFTRFSTVRNERSRLVKVFYYCFHKDRVNRDRKMRRNLQLVRKTREVLGKTFNIIRYTTTYPGGHAKPFCIYNSDIFNKGFFMQNFEQLRS